MHTRQIFPYPDSALTRFGGALIIVIAALIVTFSVWFLVKPLGSPLFLGAIMLATWLFGFRAGVFATVLSGICVDFFFITPRFELAVTAADISRLTVFVAEGMMLSWLIDGRKIAAEKAEDSEQQLRELSLHQQTLREAEQKRIALEIHDELGQSLTGIKLGVHWLDKQIKETGENQSKLAVKTDELLKSIDSTISTVRRIATDLRPSVLDDFGLVAAIEWQAHEFEKRTEMPCLFQTNIENIDLDSETATAIFRIFQETLTNIIKHAEASSVKVNFQASKNQILLRVEDNGKSFDLNAAKAKKSLGILGMRERARTIGGEFTISNNSGKGTTVELKIVSPSILIQT